VNDCAGPALNHHLLCNTKGAAMIIFAIVKEPYGWAVRRDECMMMPASCRAAAIAAAEQMVRALGSQGQWAQLLLDGAERHSVADFG